MQTYRVDLRLHHINDPMRNYLVAPDWIPGDLLLIAPGPSGRDVAVTYRLAGDERRAEIRFYDLAGREIVVPWVSEQEDVGKVIRDYQIREAERFLVALFHGADLVAVTRVLRYEASTTPGPNDDEYFF